MHPPCLVVLMLAVVTMVSAQYVDPSKSSYMEILKRRFYSNNDKYLQKNLILRDTVANVGSNSGCDNFIQTENWDYWGADIGEGIKPITYEACCAKCSNNKQCNAFTWLRDLSLCWLKSSIGNGGIYSPTGRSGYRQKKCYNVTHVENWDYWGNDIGSVINQVTYEACCAECSNNKECNAFTWVGNSTQCWLKSTTGNGGKYNSIAKSGYRQNRCLNFHWTPNWDYVGNNIGSVIKRVTTQECCTQCSNNQQCKAFTWVRDTMECYIKSTIGSGGINNFLTNSGYRSIENEGNNSTSLCGQQPCRIDTHHHIIPDIYFQAIEKIGGDPSGGPNPRWTVEQAKKNMTVLNIQMAIVSVTAPGTMVYQDDKKKARTFARELNDHSANVVKNNPKQFGYFASLPPLTDVEGTLTEIDYIHSNLKPDGYTLFSTYGSKHDIYLGNPAFDPIWAKLNQIKATVFIHPSKPPTPLVNRYLPAPLIDYPQETTRTAADIVISGTRAKYPDVKIILSHGGGTLPYIANRISLAGLDPRCPRNQEQILEDFRTFYFDTALSASAPLLQALLDFAGPTQILFGSDNPYVLLPAAEYITKDLDTFFLGKSNDYKKMWHAINYENAKRLFPNRFNG